MSAITINVRNNTSKPQNVGLYEKITPEFVERELKIQNLQPGKTESIEHKIDIGGKYQKGDYQLNAYAVEEGVYNSRATDLDATQNDEIFYFIINKTGVHKVDKTAFSQK